MTSGRAAKSSETRATSALSALSNRTFREIWFATLGSNVGGMIQSVGAAWMMTTISGSATMVALVATATSLPILVCSLAAGAVADSFDRRKVMIIAQGFMLVVSTGLAVATFAGWITPWWLLALTFLVGCGTAFNNPAWQASVGEMVPRPALPSAVSLNSMAFNIARSAGPALGGFLVAVAGAAAAFAVNAASYLALIAVLLRWTPDRKGDDGLPRERLAEAIGGGLRYAVMSPHVRVMLLRGAVASVTSSAVMVLMPLIARHRILGGPITYGFLLGAFGAGAVCGAMINTRLRTRYATETILRGCYAALASATLILAFSGNLWTSMPALVIAGGGWMLIFASFGVTVQLSSPRWVLGRALSLYHMAVFGGSAVGGVVWGWATDSVGVAGALGLSAAAQTASLALAWVFPLPEVETWNLAPLDDPPLTLAASSLKPSEGAIVVAVRYLIATADAAEFQSVMRSARRIRQRDGARRWSLMQDLENPEVWVEHYQTQTWHSHVRHEHRRTFEDAAIGRRARALHRGDRPPEVSWLIQRP